MTWPVTHADSSDASHATSRADHGRVVLLTSGQGRGPMPSGREGLREQAVPRAEYVEVTPARR